MLHEATRVGADSDAHSEFFFAGGAAREEQIDNVGAGDEQDEADGGEQNEQALAHLRGGGILQRTNEDAEAFVLRGVGNGGPAIERFKFRAGLRDGYAGLESRDGCN